MDSKEAAIQAAQSVCGVKQADKLTDRFTPDYTPEQLENLGVYDALYRGHGPRLASLGEWKPEWVNPVDPKGWAQWYKRYSGGRRLGEEDERQIKRWLNFKSRHGGPFVKNPTPRRGWALRNWGIDPSKLVDKEQAQVVRDMLDEYQRRKMQQYVREKVAAGWWPFGRQTTAAPTFQPSQPPLSQSQPASLDEHRDPPPAQTKLPAFTNQYKKPAFTPPTATPTGRSAEVLARNPTTGALDGGRLVQQQIYDYPVVKPVQAQENPNGQAAWSARNYDGIARRDAHDHIANAALATPQTSARYNTIIDNKFQVGLANKRAPVNIVTDQQHLSPQDSAGRANELRDSFVKTPDGELDRLMFLPKGEQFMGGHAQARRIARRARGEPTALSDLGYELPSMTRGLVGLHELEHVNQNNRPTINEIMNDNGNHTFRIEAPAVLKEIAHGTDAAHSATGAPVSGSFNLTPTYRPSLEWIRQQATQHGLEGMGGKTAPGRTMTELLNTPEGQRWLQMQTAELEKGSSAVPRQYVQTQLKQSAELAGRNSERQIGGNVKQAELVPEVQLQEHQQRIADRVSSEDPRMLVYHGLGSGKSLSALAAAEAAKKKYQDDYGIVVPASLRGNFQKEVKKFTKGSDPEIMSYTGLALGKHFKDQPETLIMDEAHRLRNPEAASSQAARRVADQAKRVMLLTGSPITNSPTDLAGLLSMLTDKTITPEEFQKRYVGYQNVSPGWINWLRGIKPGEKPYVKNENELRQMLQGKVDYQPSKTPEGVNVNEETIRVPLSAEQQKIQKAIRTKIPPGFLWKLDREFPLSRDELSRLNSFLTGLRQVGLSTQPFRVDKDPAKAFTQSAKLQTAMKNLQQVLDSDPRKKAIIYSNFIDSGLKPYSAALEKAQIPHGIFHGSVPVKQRLQALKDYNEGKLRALLLGPAAAEGISTKGTSLIQLLDPHWHESRSQQAKGRGLRFDSHADLPEELKNVAVQRYISSSQDPSWLGKWLGYQRERTGDEVLEHLTADKERLNEEFRKILRDIGTKK